MILGFLLSIAAALAQASGGFLVLGNRKWPGNFERLMLALGAGFLLALVFIELIPESFVLTGSPSNSVIAMLVGFSALHFFEHTAVEHMHFGEETHSGVSHSSVFGAVGGLALHAFFDGMSICAASQASTQIGLLVFVAVLLHKVPEGLTVASVMVAGHKPRKQIAFATLALALATIIGAVVVLLFVSIDTRTIGFLFAFSAGSSLYVGASDLIPEINKTRGRMAPLLVFLGMLLFWLGERMVSILIGL